MNDLLERIKVLSKSVLGWLTITAAILVGVSQQLKEIGGLPEPVVRWVTSAGAVLTIVVLQVRQHVPVDPSQRGLLPPKGPATPTLDAAGEIHEPDVGLALIELLVGGLILLFIGYLLFR